MTSELSPTQVAVYLESTCALIEAELKALGDDASWHQAPGEWCAREVVGHIIEAEKRGFAGRIRLILANPGLKLEAWDQVAVEKERNDCARVTDSLWMEFMGLRHDSVNLVTSLKPTDLDRAHKEANPYTRWGHALSVTRLLFLSWKRHFSIWTRRSSRAPQRWPSAGRS